MLQAPTCSIPRASICDNDGLDGQSVWLCRPFIPVTEGRISHPSSLEGLPDGSWLVPKTSEGQTVHLLCIETMASCPQAA